MKVEFEQVKEDFARKDAEIKKLNSKLSRLDDEIFEADSSIDFKINELRKINYDLAGEWRKTKRLVSEIEELEMFISNVRAIKSNMELYHEQD